MVRVAQERSVRGLRGSPWWGGLRNSVAVLVSHTVCRESILTRSGSLWVVAVRGGPSVLAVQPRWSRVEWQSINQSCILITLHVVQLATEPFPGLDVTVDHSSHFPSPDVTVDHSSPDTGTR